jgi:hypothetical protein
MPHKRITFTMNSPVTTIMLQENDGERCGWLAALPSELLRDKLVQPFLTVPDVLALQSTCRYLYHSIALVPLHPPRSIFPLCDDESVRPGLAEQAPTDGISIQVQDVASLGPVGGLINEMVRGPLTHGIRVVAGASASQHRLQELRIVGDERLGDRPQPLCRLRPIFSSSGSRVHSCQLHFTWSDQGWGNRKGMVYVVARLPQKQNDADATDDQDDLYGGKIIAQSSESAPHEVKSSFLSFHTWPCSESVEYYMFVSAGGGGGHVLQFREISLRTVVLDPTAGNAQRPLSRSYQILTSLGAISSRHPRRITASPESWAEEQRFMTLEGGRNRPHRGSCSGVVYPNGALAYPVTTGGSGHAKLSRSVPLQANFSMELLAQLLRSAQSPAFAQVAPSVMNVLARYGIHDTTPKLLEAMETVLQAECEEQWCLEQERLDRQEQGRQELLREQPIAPDRMAEMQEGRVQLGRARAQVQLARMRRQVRPRPPAIPPVAPLGRGQGNAGAATWRGWNISVGDHLRAVVYTGVLIGVLWTFYSWKML